MRETVAQLNELFESQDRQIEILRSDVCIESEIESEKNELWILIWFIIVVYFHFLFS